MFLKKTLIYVLLSGTNIMTRKKRTNVILEMALKANSSSIESLVDKVNLDTSIISSTNNYILVPSREDNCFVLERNCNESVFLTDNNNCTLID